MYTSAIAALSLAFSQAFVVDALPTQETSAVATTQNEKRQGCFAPVAYCFGDRGGMDHTGTDESAQWLKNWAGAGTTIATKDHNLWVGQTYNNAVVYACTDDEYGSNMFTADDVSKALGVMDDHCEAYEASYAIWYDFCEDHNSGKIIGKDFGNIPVCQGYNGN